MPNIRILSARQRRELYESITPNETIIEVVGGKNHGYIGTVVRKSNYYGSRVNRNNNYFMVTIQTKHKKTQVGCNNIKIYEEVEEDMSNKFTKDMLKTGMVVELRSGELALIVDKHIMFQEANRGLRLCDYDYELKFKTSINPANFDVIKVYNISRSDAFNFSFSKSYMGDLIWERQEKSEVQLKIEKLEETIKTATKQIQELKSRL